ncbi:uncharacterized protein G2W53_016230 [Senna tora]|uniref:Uncharacterized protein n=1 Tax=Senna tora TaxID=362788 RepID=A0A834WMU0_9FABA|nr:uncharacterized protein G2W53_016230 [Senna tora]
MTNEGQVSHSESFNEDEGWVIPTLQGKTRCYEWMKVEFLILNPSMRMKVGLGLSCPRPPMRMKAGLDNSHSSRKYRMIWMNEGQVSHSESFKEDEGWVRSLMLETSNEDKGWVIPTLQEKTE